MRAANRRFKSVQAAIAIAAFALGGCGDRRGSPVDAYQAFERAWKSGDAEALDDCVDQETLDYIRALQPWIFVGDEESMESLKPFDRYLVLLIRMRFDSLRSEDWEAWFQRLQSGSEDAPLSGYIIGILEDSLFEVDLGAVDTYAGVTAGKAMRSGSDTGLRLRFRYQGGWKLDLRRYLMDEFERSMKPYLNDRYRNQDRIWEMLKSNYGDRMNRGLWRSRVAPHG